MDAADFHDQARAVRSGAYLLFRRATRRGDGQGARLAREALRRTTELCELAEALERHEAGRAEARKNP